jgi:hypothetical protein
MAIYKRNDTASFEFLFIDANTNEPINVTDPVYSITYFNGSAEVVVVASTSMVHIGIGQYAVSWLIPPTAVVNQTYFVHASGVHPIDLTDTTLDETFQIFADDYFGTSTGGGLIIKFTKD